jgi:hypothetical protein
VTEDETLRIGPKRDLRWRNPSVLMPSRVLPLDWTRQPAKERPAAALPRLDGSSDELSIQRLAGIGIILLGIIMVADS